MMLLTSCKNQNNDPILRKKNNSEVIIDTMPAKKSFLDTTSADFYYDSLFNSPKDTSTLESKRQRLYNRFIVENKLSSPEYDTLIDLTYDGYKDYIIGYYGQSGSGIKNRVEVYIYSKRSGNYLLDEQISNLMNPTFYISRKRITGFYLAHGGGDGIQLEWKGSKWITTMEFSVDNKGEKSIWQIYYPLKRQRKAIIRAYQFIPPLEILETDIEI